MQINKNVEFPKALVLQGMNNHSLIHSFGG